MSEFQDDGDLPPEVVAKQVEQAKMTQPKVEVIEADDDYEQYEDVAQDAQNKPREKKEGGFMNKLFNFGNKKQDQEREDNAMLVQQQQQNIEDLKETIKVLHRWLEKLPPDKIYEFKKSPDFEKYKEGLRKLGLIKE
ncbi:MAG: hypothetical protein ACP5N2_07475 [Candidatus Nanoarchaeia archaeon]